jgi:hypothetical protein
MHSAKAAEGIPEMIGILENLMTAKQTIQIQGRTCSVLRGIHNAYVSRQILRRVGMEPSAGFMPASATSFIRVDAKDVLRRFFHGFSPFQTPCGNRDVTSFLLMRQFEISGGGRL